MHYLLSNTYLPSTTTRCYDLPLLPTLTYYYSLLLLSTTTTTTIATITARLPNIIKSGETHMFLGMLWGIQIVKKKKKDALGYACSEAWEHV